MQFKSTILISSLLLGAVSASPLTMDGARAANTDSHTLSSRDDFTCTGKTDGYYQNSSDCTTYYACVGGIQYLMQCPPTLFYNDKIIQCDYPANVDDCPAAPTTTYSSGPLPTTKAGTMKGGKA